MIAWNTGRKYSDKGQRIAAKLLTTKQIAFLDVDREIFGLIDTWIDADDDLLNTPKVIEMETMVQYDAGYYKEMDRGNAWALYNDLAALAAKK